MTVILLLFFALASYGQTLFSDGTVLPGAVVYGAGGLKVTSTATVVTMSKGNTDINGTGAQMPTAATLTKTGGTDTGTFLFYVDYNSGTPVRKCLYGAGISIGNYTVSSGFSGSTCASGSAFPTGLGIFPRATVAIASGVFSTPVDYRPDIQRSIYSFQGGCTEISPGVVDCPLGGATCFSTAGEGHWYPNVGNTGATTTNPWPVNGANYTAVFQFTIPCSMTVGKVVIHINTASGTCGGTCGLALGLYNSSKSLLGQTTTITSGGSPNFNSTGAVTLSFSSPVSLTAGVYYYALSTNSSAAVFTAFASDGFLPVMINANGTRNGRSANDSTGTSTITMPSALGTITAATNSYGNPPVLLFER